MRTAFTLHHINKALLTQGVHQGDNPARCHTARRRQQPGTYATLQQLAHLIAQHFNHTPQPLDPLGATAVSAAMTQRTRVEAIMAPLLAAMLADERMGQNGTADAPGGYALLAKRMRKMLAESVSRATQQQAVVNL